MNQSLKELLSNIVMAATELHVSGAIRPEHSERWSMVRDALEKAHALVDEPDVVAAPDAAAFVDVAEQLRTLAAIIDLQGDKVDAIAAKLEV